MTTSYQIINRKRGLLVALLTLLILLATGTWVQASKVKLIYWHPWGFGQWQEFQNKLVQDFNQSQSNIVVEVEILRSFDSLLVAVAAGTPPDVVTLFVPPDRCSLPSLFQPVGHLIERDDIDKAKFVPGGFDLSSWNGMYYGMPFLGASYGLYWNTAVFDKLGLDSARGPVTWTQLTDYMKKTTMIDDKGDYTQIGLAAWDRDPRLQMTWFWSNNGNFYDAERNEVVVDSPENIETLTWLMDLAGQYGQERVRNLGPSFYAATSVMTIDGSWIISDINNNVPQLEFNVGPIPRADDGQFANPGGGEVNTMYIPIGSMEIDAAWEFINYMVKEGAAKWCNLGAEVPAYIPAASDVEWWQDQRYRIFAELTKYNRTLMSPVNDFLYEQFSNAYWSAINGEKMPQQALQDLKRIVDSKIKKTLIR